MVACASVCLREIAVPCDAVALCESLQAEPYPWLLDSALQDGRLGRYSFAGSDPYLVVRAFGERVELECRRAVRPGLSPGSHSVSGDPLAIVRSLLPVPSDVARDAHDLSDLPFAGGAVGYLGYELAQQIEPLELRARDDLGLPDLVLLFVDRLLIVDHGGDRAFAVGLGFGSEAETRAHSAADELAARVEGQRWPGPRVESSEDDLARRRRLLSTSLPAGARSDFDECAYARTVAATKDEIAAGNVYQANLTQRMDVAFPGNAWSLYCALRRASPAPFAAFLGLPEVAVLSSSPERFLRLDEQGRVESRPIKGTRPRGANPRTDDALCSELATSAKDRAENLMIVDLVRNDLGRVCQTGSVRVPELMAIESYASVFQMVSTVTGRLARDRDAVDLIRAAFPPGSMTGAPKIAAMKILDRLEPVRRGVYSGAIGYLDVRGGLDFSVVIRTLLVQGGRAYLHAGGGVVADSDPVAEYHETVDKSRALWAALADLA